MTENTQKGQRYWGVGEIGKGGEGNPLVERNNKKTWDSLGRKGSGEGIHGGKLYLMLLHF